MRMKMKRIEIPNSSTNTKTYHMLTDFVACDTRLLDVYLLMMTIPRDIACLQIN